MSKRDLLRLADASEYAVTVAVADLLRVAANPGWLWSHFPAGEYRTGATGARLWRMGLQKGWSDFFLISPQGLLHVLELKTLTGTVQPEQKKFLTAMGERNIPNAVARGVDEAFAQLFAWDVISDRATVTRGRG